MPPSRNATFLLNENNMKKVILTVAGSDTSAGAGIQADLKTITCLGGYGMTVITALTAQNPSRVHRIMPVPDDFVAAQLDALLGELPIDAVKTGMLPNQKCIEIVAERLKRFELRKVVVDPVMVAASGSRLIDDAAVESLVHTLFPLADLVTPNLIEASLLAGMEVSTPEQMRLAAEAIMRMGPKAVLVKGGHLRSDVVLDLLLEKSGFQEFVAPRVASTTIHGTGCTLASAVATLWAKGATLAQAVKAAKSFLSLAIARGIRLGNGPGTPDQTAHLPIEEALNQL
jgi:hydroxymethylpyrimidine kinase/phosphomethylpyrimidine kinase